MSSSLRAIQAKNQLQSKIDIDDGTSFLFFSKNTILAYRHI